MYENQEHGEQLHLYFDWVLCVCNCNT